jgi:hypothetical protein
VIVKNGGVVLPIGVGGGGVAVGVAVAVRVGVAVGVSDPEGVGLPTAAMFENDLALLPTT